MLCSKHVRLRAIEEDDLPMLAQWRSDPEVYGYFHEYVPLSLADQREWFTRQRNNKAEMNFAVTTHENTLLGTAGLVHIDHRNRKAEIARVLISNPDKRSASLGSQVLLLILQYGFEHLNLRKMHGEVLVSNVSALSYYKGFGFVEEGVLREHVYKDSRYHDVAVLGLLRKDYYASKEEGLINKLSARYL